MKRSPLSVRALFFVEALAFVWIANYILKVSEHPFEPIGLGFLIFFPLLVMTVWLSSRFLWRTVFLASCLRSAGLIWTASHTVTGWSSSAAGCFPITSLFSISFLIPFAFLTVAGVIYWTQCSFVAGPKSV